MFGNFYNKMILNIHAATTTPHHLERDYYAGGGGGHVTIFITGMPFPRRYATPTSVFECLHRILSIITAGNPKLHLVLAGSGELWSDDIDDAYLLAQSLLIRSRRSFRLDIYDADDNDILSLIGVENTDDVAAQ
jgi:hypothetical protein